MATTDRNEAVTTDPSQLFPTKYLPRPEVRDLPAPPARQWRFVGPGIVAAGVGLASGELPGDRSRPTGDPQAQRKCARIGAVVRSLACRCPSSLCAARRPFVLCPIHPDGGDNVLPGDMCRCDIGKGVLSVCDMSVGFMSNSQAAIGP